jgi:hypothetical protein
MTTTEDLLAANVRYDDERRGKVRKGTACDVTGEETASA